MEAFLEFAIVGTVLSLAIDWINSHYNVDSLMNKALVVALSLGLGGGFYFLESTPYWQAVLGVLASASTVWALVIRKTS